MQRTFLVTMALLTLLLPVVMAHTDGGPYGTPKTYCEDLKGDQNVHDYAINGFTGVIYILFGMLDGNLTDCDGDGVPGDYDGHSEWAQGGAWLLVSDATSGSGATVCFGEEPHHPTFPDVWIFDHIWPGSVLFIVGADTTSRPVTSPDDPAAVIDCGDGIDDIDTGYCQDHCSVRFPPGIDGAYHVYVVNEIFGNGIVDGPIAARQESDQSGPGVVCFQDPTDPASWICVYTNRSPQTPDPHFAMAGHVYT